MVRPVKYQPTKAFKLPEADVEKYKKIAAQIKEKTPDASKSVGTIADSLTTCAGYVNEAWDPVKDDKVDSKEIDLVGEEADTKDIFFEEPKKIAEDDDADDVDERSLWGDGDNNPEDAE